MIKNSPARAADAAAKLLLAFSVAALNLSGDLSLCAAQGNNNNNNASANPCETYGRCGPYGSCNSQETPICSCLQGFDPANRPEWNTENWAGGCVRRTALNCSGQVNATSSDGFWRLQQMKISGYSDRWVGPESACRNMCLTNCSCIAYGYDSGIGCMFWSGRLIDIQRFPSGSGSDLYIRLANSELAAASAVNNNKKGSKKVIIIVAVVVALVVVLISSSLFAWKWRAKKRGYRKANEPPKSSSPTPYEFSSQNDALSQFNRDELPLFKIETLANATDGFSEAKKLGKGGFGPVYKGTLENGKEIAVKRLSQTSGQGMQEFMNEVTLISKLQHRNLVRLLGCCVENKESMLVYEYMPNKSLDFFLFDPSQDVLDWRKRFNIIEGICRGLLYLHRDSRLKIIHRDLKPSNILLDNDFVPKISDFGMARIFGAKQDHVSTIRVVGTYGYMAPEYAMEGRFSEKSDVFSYGVLMLEIVTGRRNTSFHNQEGSLNLLGHVWKLWNEDQVTTLIDSRISSDGDDHQAEVMRCMHIGLLCVQELPRDRPTISNVLSMLSSEIMDLPEPKQPAFAIKHNRPVTAGSSSSHPSQQSAGSVNNVTLTVVEGR